MVWSGAKVQGGKKFTANHPLAEEIRGMRMMHERQQAFEVQAETGSKPNPLASLPGAKKPENPRRFIPGVTKPNG